MNDAVFLMMNPNLYKLWIIAYVYRIHKLSTEIFFSPWWPLLISVCHSPVVDITFSSQVEFSSIFERLLSSGDWVLSCITRQGIFTSGRGHLELSSWIELRHTLHTLSVHCKKFFNFLIWWDALMWALAWVNVSSQIMTISMSEVHLARYLRQFPLSLSIFSGNMNTVNGSVFLLEWTFLFRLPCVSVFWSS